MKVIIDGAKLRRFHELFGTILKKSFMECVDAFFDSQRKVQVDLPFRPLICTFRPLRRQKLGGGSEMFK